MHRIRRQILDLELPREAGAVVLQQRAGQVFQEKVLPRLDEVFSRLAPGDRYVRIERLDIDLGDIGEVNWEQKFVERCVEKITRQVVEQITCQVAEQTFDTGAGPAEMETLTPEANALAVFRYFLETGLLPWYAGDTSLKSLESGLVELLEDQPAMFREVLSPLFRQHAAAAQRLVWQFSPRFTTRIVESVLNVAPGWIEHAVRIYRSQSGRTPEPALQAAFLRILLEEAAPEWREKLPEAPLVAQLFFRAAAGLDTGFQVKKERGKPSPESAEPDAPLVKIKPLPEQPPPPGKRQAATEAALEGIFIDNAGVVLLGVYLPAFFSGLNLVVDNEFASIEAQYRAVHLIHFLATGQEQPEEPVLALPKILCGLDIDEPVPPDLTLNESEKKEALQLLEAAIRNWSVLKNTGPDGLREAFLQRAGFLAWSEERAAWLLRLERLGQDLLLERLPWSFSVIKLPWMPGMVQVEW